MEKPEHIPFFSRRALLLAVGCLILPLQAGESPESSGAATREVSRRQAALVEAQELIHRGDEAYTAGRYSEAVEAYAGARDLIPDAPISFELRSAATERYAQASVESARALSRVGDVAAAKAAVDKVLDPSVAPTHAGAMAFRAQLNDPIRTNPSLTAKVTKDVETVRRSLYTAEGAYQLGKYDEAKDSYEKVLRIDPTNTAARRGMEQVANAKSNYQKAAYDHTRAELLGEASQQWETVVPGIQVEPTLNEPLPGDADSNFISVKNKLDRIIIPKFQLDQATLSDALELLRLRASEYDTLETDPARKGVNITVNLGPQDSVAATRARNVRIDLQLSLVPLSQVLKYITQITHTSYSTDNYSVSIVPIGSVSKDLITQTYRVPTDFISSLSTGAEGKAVAEDPFAKAPANEGLLTKRVGAQEALTLQGAEFPPGASASYSPASNTLRVVNTAANQEYIAQIIETVSKTEPLLVSVHVTMIRVEKNRLEELGYDWLLDNFGFGGSPGASGVSPLNLSGGTQGNGDDLGDIKLAEGATARNPITAGNRSGDSATPGTSIDNLLSNQTGSQVSNRAPGILGVNGSLDGAHVQALMRGLDQKKGVDVMSKPSIVTRSGQASSIVISREFIYPTEYEPPQLAGIGSSQSVGTTQTATPANPSAFQKRDVGISLEVLPVVDSGKQFITVTLNPSLSNFDGFVNYGSPINSVTQGTLGAETFTLTENAILMPVFSDQKLSTQVDVADGATMVLGGLMKDSVQNVEDRTPGLGKLPLVGRFFQSKSRKAVSTAIIFLVNVELMDPTGRRLRQP